MKLHCYCDGGYNNLTKENGYCSWCVYAVDDTGHKRLVNKKSRIPLPNINSSNQAEYSALILLLEGIGRYYNPEFEIIIYTDSKLVEGQMSGKFKVKSANLIDKYNFAKKIFNQYRNIRIEWVTRKVMLEIFGH